MELLYPYVDLVIIKISVFPIVLIVAIFSCIFVYIFSSKYDMFYFPVIRGSSLYCMVGAGICGKLLYILTRSTSSNLSVIDRIGGFVFFGGLIGAVLGLYVYSKLKWNRFLDLLDTYISVIPLGQAIGRIGCYLNGCCYGIPYTGILAVRYIVDGKETRVFPTWFIESLFCFVIFVCMFLISKRVQSGTYSAIYIISYSVFRFIIEFFRGDSIRGIWFGLSTSQYICILFLLFGIIILIKSIHAKENNLLIKGR